MRIQLWDDPAGVPVADIDVAALPRHGDTMAVRYHGNAPGSPATTLHFRVDHAVFHVDDIAKPPADPKPAAIVVHGRVQ
jgi:hypothetical protein